MKRLLMKSIVSFLFLFSFTTVSYTQDDEIFEGEICTEGLLELKKNGFTFDWSNAHFIQNSV